MRETRALTGGGRGRGAERRGLCGNSRMWVTRQAGMAGPCWASQTSLRNWPFLPRVINASPLFSALVIF